MSKDRKLGKGLEAILGMDTPGDDNADTMGAMDLGTAGLGAAETSTSTKSTSNSSYDTSFGDDFLAGLDVTPTTKPAAATKKTAKKIDVDLSSLDAAASKTTAASAVSTTPAAGVWGSSTDYQVQNLPIEQIDSNPWQPRTEFEAKAIQELANSIAEHGLMTPIQVRPFKGRYQVVAGERRLRAFIRLGRTEIPARIQETTDREMAELALIENLQRQDLNAIEKALAFQRYIDENHCKQEELARILNIDRSTLTNMLRLLDLPEEIQKYIRDGKMTAGHGRALLPLVKKQDQIEMCQRILAEDLSTRQVEDAVSQWVNRDRKPGQSIKDVEINGKASRSKKSAQILDLERQFSEALDLKVKISVSDKGNGKLEIFFRNNNEFESLLDYFQE